MHVHIFIVSLHIMSHTLLRKDKRNMLTLSLLHACLAQALHCAYYRMAATPGRNGTRARVVYYGKYAVFTPNFVCITARYFPKPFISGAIENKVKKGGFQFCVRWNLWLLNFNDPECCLLQDCFNIETPSSLIIF